MTPTIAVQYLEHYEPRLHTPAAVRQRLQAACDQLPVSLVLLGWNAPGALVDVCAEVAARQGARLFRWQPMLTSDGVFFPLPEWRTISLNGEIVPGYHSEPEFTFVCPNRPEARQAALLRLEAVLRGSPYQGVFLDRIRYPSPAANPEARIACFCESCRQAASQEGLDLDAVQLFLSRRLAQAEGCLSIVKNLLTASHARSGADLLASFLDFRQNTITRFVAEAAAIAASQGMTVGLDCFTPRLARLVGQDLEALNATRAWIKIMAYTHTLAPAGLPYELLGLAHWLVRRTGQGERKILQRMAEFMGLPLPASLAALRADGLPPETLTAEIQLGRALGIDRLSVGVALVDLPGVNRASAAQYAADLAACRTAAADGLVLSWDLWHISPALLEQTRNFCSS